MGTGSKAASKPAAITPALPSPLPPPGSAAAPAPAAAPPPPPAPPAGSSPLPALPAPAGPGPAGAGVLPPPGDEITPVPDVVPGDAPAGVPVLAGEGNLAASTATLMSFSTPGGPREVLLATVTEESEPVLMEALAVSATKLVPVHVQEEVHGRLPLDTERQLHEKVARAARSVNHKLKNNIPVPATTAGYYQDARQAIQGVIDDPGLSADEKTMAAYYGQQLDAVAARIEPAFGIPYDKGGRIPPADPYQHSGMATVTREVMQPAAPGDLLPGQHPAVLRDASRIKAAITPVTGLSGWDGHSRVPANGKEYAVDLGDGWSAVYRAHAGNDPHKHDYSLRGQLEVHAPPGAGHGRQLVERLASLNLAARPMTTADAELAYLRANITAQGLAGHEAVTSALATAGALEHMEVQEIFHARQHELAALSGQSLDALARQIELDAATRCLPKKLRALRDGVAKAAGFPSGEALAASPGYDPLPGRSGGWLTWGRFDVTSAAAAGKLRQAWSGKTLVHKVTGGAMADIIATGVLAATERRAVMGLSSGLGTSEEADKKSGGANSVFLRAASGSHPGARAFVWDDPCALLGRSDYYAYNSDHFGSVNPASHSTDGMTRDPFKIAGFAGSGGNEVMIMNGIDLLGREAPSRIICSSASERNAVLALLASRGISHLAGKPVTDVVTT